MLVLLACLWQPGFVVVAVYVLHEFHLSVNGEPVGVYVPKTHEDGNHQSAVVEVGRIVHLFNNHNLAICRCHHQVVGVFDIQVSYWTSVEVEYDTIYRTKDYYENPERNLVVNGAP